MRNPLTRFSAQHARENFYTLEAASYGFFDDVGLLIEHRCGLEDDGVSIEFVLSLDDDKVGLRNV